MQKEVLAIERAGKLAEVHPIRVIGHQTVVDLSESLSNKSMAHLKIR